MVVYTIIQMLSSTIIDGINWYKLCTNSHITLSPERGKYTIHIAELSSSCHSSVCVQVKPASVNVGFEKGEKDGNAVHELCWSRIHSQNSQN